MKKIILHIGQPKTGTTSIQLALDRHQDSYIILTPYSGNLRPKNFITSFINPTDENHAAAKTWYKKFLDSPQNTAILSDEYFFPIQKTVANFIAQLRKEDGVCFEIILHIANVTPWSLSLVQQMLRYPIHYFEGNNSLLDFYDFNFVASYGLQLTLEWIEFSNQFEHQYVLYPISRDKKAILVENFFQNLKLVMDTSKINIHSNKRDSLELSSVLLTEHLKSPEALSTDKIIYFQKLHCLTKGFGAMRGRLSNRLSNKILDKNARIIHRIEEEVGFSISKVDTLGNFIIDDISDMVALGVSKKAELLSYIAQRWDIDTSHLGSNADAFSRCLEMVTDQEGRLIRLPQDFNEVSYLSQNPDIARSGIDPEFHYRTYGFKEGRLY